MDARIRFVTAGGLRSPCLDTGGDSTEAAVFVHGNPGSSQDWRELVSRVSEFGRAVAFDMPGFGQADKPNNFDYSVSGYARHLDLLLRASNIERVHLLVHDFGGPWGLAWATRNPDRVASVTLFNIGILPGYRWHFLARLWRMPIIGELFQMTTTRFGFRNMLKIGNPRGLPPNMVERMYDEYDAGTKRAVLRLYRASDPELVEQYSQQCVATLGPRDIPALVFWGERDIYLPSKYAEVQKQVFPSAKIVMMPDSGHWPFADNPSVVCSHLLPFLRQQMTARVF